MLGQGGWIQRLRPLFSTAELVGAVVHVTATDCLFAVAKAEAHAICPEDRVFNVRLVSGQGVRGAIEVCETGLGCFEHALIKVRCVQEVVLGAAGQKHGLIVARAIGEEAHAGLQEAEITALGIQLHPYKGSARSFRRSGQIHQLRKRAAAGSSRSPSLNT